MSFLSLFRHRISPQRVNPLWWVSFGDRSYVCEQNCEYNSEQRVWQDGAIAVHRIQPQMSASGRFVVVGDDRDSVIEQLEMFGDVPTAVAKLKGMFGFVIWDRECRQLSVVRDPVGARTLYYTVSDSRVWIAPRLRTLAPFHCRELDPVALRDYLCCAFVPGEQTLWKGVREVRPGTVHRWVEGASSPEIEVYWQPQEQIGDRQQPLEWYGQQLRSRLTQVVDESLPQGEPVGAYLSGGLDSSCITALACQLHDRPVHTYSIHFGQEYPHELEFSGLVAQHCQTQHHILEIKPQKVWEMLPITMAHLDDPIGDPLTVPNYLLGQAAKEEVGVILNGEGGDPCFGGPKNKPMLLYELYRDLSGVRRDRLTTYLDSFKKYFVHLPQLLRSEIWEEVKEVPSVFSSDLNSPLNYLNRLMLLNIKFKGADHILTKVNNLTYAAGIEGRSPLFDRRIVDFSLQIPPEYKLSGSQEKAVLKVATADLLPDEIIHRPKSGMRVPVGWWFSKYWQRRTKALLLDKNAAISPYFNQHFIRELFNPESPYYHKFGIKLWMLVSLEFWLQTYRSWH